MENPQLRDNRFVPEKLWTEVEMKCGSYHYMNEILEYIRHVLEFQVRLYMIPFWGDPHTTFPSPNEWRRFFQRWVYEINRSFGSRISVRLQGIDAHNHGTDHIHVYVVIEWAEYPPTINLITVGIQ